MRTAARFAAILAALGSLTLTARLVAQQASQQAEAAPPPASASAVPWSSPTTPTTRLGRPMFIHAELMGQLDSKSAKVGDPVVLRVQQTVRAEDGSQIAKGARIVGRVTAVVAHVKGSADARVTVQFDRTETKGAEDLPIRAQIQWAEPMPSPSTADLMRSQQTMGGGVMGGAAQVTSGMQTGGVGAGTSGGMTVTGGMVQMTSKQTEGLGSAADYGLQAPVEVKSDGAEAHTILVAGRAAATVRATGVPGVMLAGDPAGLVSGTFLAVKQNVHLEGATRMVLAVAAIR